MPVVPYTAQITSGGLTMGGAVERLRDTLAAPTLDPALQNFGAFGAFAEQAIASSLAGPCAVLGTMAQTMGVYQDAVSAVRGVAVKAYALFSNVSALAQAAAATAKSLAAQARAAVLAASGQLQALIKDVQGLATLARAVPVAGQIVQTAIGVVKLAAATLRGLFAFAQSDATTCPPVNYALALGDLDSAGALSMLSLLGDPMSGGTAGGRVGDLTPVFSCPTGAAISKIDRPGDQGGDSFFPSFAWRPIFGPRHARVSATYALGDPPEGGDDLAAWESLRYQMGSTNATCPWLYNPTPKFRNPTRREVAGIASFASGPGVPVNVWPKMTSVAQAIWSQVTSMSAAALCVDWRRVESSWEDEYQTYQDPASVASIDQCQAGPAPWWTRREGGAWLWGSKANPKASRVFRENALWAMGQTNLGNDFTAYAFASGLAQPAPQIPSAGVYQPDFIVSGQAVIAYACQTLRARQLKIAGTTAAAYVPADVFDAMPPGFLRARLETPRAQILQTGARGVDLQLAQAADPVFGQALAAAAVQFKKTALMTGTPAPKPDTTPNAPGDLAGVTDYGPPAASGGLAGGAVLGGLALAAAAVYFGGRHG